MQKIIYIFIKGRKEAPLRRFAVLAIRRGAFATCNIVRARVEKPIRNCPNLQAKNIFEKSLNWGLTYYR